MVFGVDQIAAGRPPGIPNKAVTSAREAIARFVDGNAVRLNKWLDAIAEKDPKQAFDCYMSVVEYHIPKLSRADNTNTNVGIVQIVLEASKHRALADAVVTQSGLIEQQPVEIKSE